MQFFFLDFVDNCDDDYRKHFDCLLLYRKVLFE
jgi:hypothetical protein